MSDLDGGSRSEEIAEGTSSANREEVRHLAGGGESGPTTPEQDSRVAASRSSTGPSKKAFLQLFPRPSNPNSGDRDYGDSEIENGERMNNHQPPPDDDEAQLRTSLLPPSGSSNDVRHHPQLRRRLFAEEKLDAVWQFIRPFGNYLAFFTLCAMLLLVPLVLYRALTDKKLEKAAYRSAGVMVSGTIILSCRLVYLHLTHWYMPLQKFVVRILFMVPLYALISYLSLRFHTYRVYMGTFRDFYEAFVIASFVYYLIELLGGDLALSQLLRRKNPNLGRHQIPFKYALNDWEMGEEFMLQCKHGVLQYVLFKTIATITTFLCEFSGVYGEGEFSWTTAYPYLCFFQNLSVMYALYCLVLLYHAVNEELRFPINWHPLGKFLCIKGVVFFTWWQGVLIYYLKDHGMFRTSGRRWSSEEVANGLIDYCIVVEMVGFAIAHSFTFTYKEYLPGRVPEATNHQDEEDADGNNSSSNNNLQEEPRNSQGQYCPPATLDEPLRFKEALWSSTVPKETLHDIQRLQSDTMEDFRRIRTEIVGARLQRVVSGERRRRASPTSTTTAPHETSSSDTTTAPTTNDEVDASAGTEGS